MDRAYSNYTNHYRSDSPERSVYHRSQNQPCTDFSDPSSLLQALQNNPNLQDPQCLNKILIPMLLVQLLQNQQACHCSDVNRQAPHPEQYRSRRQQSYHDRQPSRRHSYHDDDHPVQEVYSVPAGRYRSNEFILDQSPPAIQCSDEDIRYAGCDNRSRPDYCGPMRRRNLVPSRDQQQASTRTPSPERGIVERCYWCRQQLYRYYDPDLCKRVFTHFPCHRGAILAPAGKSSYGSIRQMSLVDTSPFNPERDVMLPCPYLCAKTETTYNSSFRHPEVVARESVCRLVSKKSQPWEQSSNAPFGQSSLESIGQRDKPQLPNRLQEERVMFLKPNCCPSQAISSQMTKSSLDVGGSNRRFREPRARVTLADTSLDLSYNSRNRWPEPNVSFSPSTDEYQRHRSLEKERAKENILYYNCRPPQKSKDGGYDLYCKPDPQRRGSGRSSRSSPASSPSRSRRSRHSHASGRSRHSRRSHGNASGSRHSHRSHGNASPRSRRRLSDPSYQRRRHSAPHKSRSRGSRRSRRPRAKSDFAVTGEHQRGRRRRSQSSRRGRSQSSRRRHRSRSSRRRRHSRPRHSMSSPAEANQDYCDDVAVCCPCPFPPKSVYNASYGNPAEHPYYEGPSDSNFRRQRFGRN